jgi:aminoglycoside phosphotransferase (APT) family kinase protein
MSKAPDVESSSDKSLRSTTPNSTSTYEYSHEPFETFRAKVKALAPHVGAKFFEDIVPASTAQKVVFRVPRLAQDGDSPNEDIRTQFSILETLNNMGIQAPRVLAYDCTSDNAIEMPFSLQTRLEGQGLDLVYQSLTIAERLGIASELVRILVAIENVKFQNPDRLCCSAEVSARKTVEDVDNSVLSNYLLVQGFGVGIGSSKSKTNTRTTSSLQELLSTQLDAWLQRELSDGWASFVADMFRRLKEIYTEMEELGFFQERASLNPNVLYHWDLEPRNIIVKRRTTGCSSEISEPHHWEITGVLDWDDALSVPSILARKPPVWLWDFSDDESLPSSVLADYDGDVDLLPPEF